jgi:proline racemase
MGMSASVIETVDYHTGGEPFRIVPAPPVTIAGDTVADRRARAIGDAQVDGLRRLLVCEPRGHADMYGGFVTEPDDAGADLGVLFWHKDGFSTACGHGTIALGTWAVESGRVPAHQSGVTEVIIDVPSGRVAAHVHTNGERVAAVDFINVPSHCIATAIPVVTSRGEVTAAIGFGGAIYAHVEAAALGLRVEVDQLDALIALGREIKRQLNDHAVARHSTDQRLSGIYGTIFFDDLGVTADGDLHQRNVTIFADGEVDRSPCGSGTGSRIAVLAAEGRMAPGTRLVHDSIIGSRFIGRIAQTVSGDGVPAVIPIVTGSAHRTGEHRFFVDPDDDLVPGFVLR